MNLNVSPNLVDRIKKLSLESRARTRADFLPKLALPHGSDTTYIGVLMRNMSSG
jgi:hypothetical protein